MWNLPGPGTDPVSLALAGGFLATGPPGEVLLQSPGRKFSAAAAAKSLQSCPTLCDPIDSSPPVSPIPGILQARTLEWVAISFSNAWKWKVKANSLSHVWLLATPWNAAYQAPPSMGFSRQKYWSGVPLPSPGSERREWKSWLKTQHSENKDHGITSWQIDGETMETVADFILGGSKITADGDCSHEIKRCLLLGRKIMTNLDRILKSRETLLCQQSSV